MLKNRTYHTSMNLLLTSFEKDNNVVLPEGNLEVSEENDKTENRGEQL